MATLTGITLPESFISVYETHYTETKKKPFRASYAAIARHKSDTRGALLPERQPPSPVRRPHRRSPPSPVGRRPPPRGRPATPATGGGAAVRALRPRGIPGPGGHAAAGRPAPAGLDYWTDHGAVQEVVCGGTHTHTRTHRNSHNAHTRARARMHTQHIAHALR